MLRLAILVGAMAVAGGCTRAGGRTDARSTEVTVVRRTVEDVFLMTGELQAVTSDELTVPAVEGFRVQIKWLAEDGTEVVAGQPVAELDAGEVSRGLEEKRLALVQARIAVDQHEASQEAELSQKRLELEKAEIEAEKARIEAAVPRALRSRKEWHEKQQALRKAEVELAKARLALDTQTRSSKADLAVLRITEEKAARQVVAAETGSRELSLTAPKAGVVLIGRGRSRDEDRPLQAGDNVWPGTRIASIPNVGRMEVVAYLPEVDDGRVIAGQAARVILESDLHQALPGRVEEVSAIASDSRGAGGFRARVALDQPSGPALRPGLSARVEVVRRTFQDALVVPRNAVARRGGEWMVRRPGGATAEVRVIACLPLECVISDGLVEGDRVALP